MTQNLTQQAVAESLLANQILEEYGLDGEDRHLMWQLITSGSEAGRRTFDQILTPAIREARRRLAQESEGSPPGLERF